MMTETDRHEVCVVGCGRWLRRDDEVGLRVLVSLMNGPRMPGTVFRITESPATDIPNWADGLSLLVIVDAAMATESHPAGTVQKMDYWKHRDRIRRRAVKDTHTMSVDAALAIAEGLGALPSEVWIYAVAVGDCSFGTDASEEVQQAIDVVSRRIRLDVEDWLGIPRGVPCMR